MEKLVQATLQQSEPKLESCSYASALELKVEAPEKVSATRLHKRQIGHCGDGHDDGNESELKRARLTQENLALFNKTGWKKGTTKLLASAPPVSTVESSTTKTTSTTTTGFAMLAYKNGIQDLVDSRPPTNLEEIRKRCNRSRGTASPTESVYEDYVERVGSIPNEATLVFEMGRRILKTHGDKGYQTCLNQAFTAFPKDVGFNNGLSAPQPDFVEGLGMAAYYPVPVDEHVEGAVLYKDNPRSVTLPHLAGEWKGRGKDVEEARLQSAYDGAALVYARNQALAYLGIRDPPGHAKITTFTTNGTNLVLYAHYAAPAGDGMIKYHQYPINSIDLTYSHQGLKDGRKALRNEQDHAWKQSCALKDQLKEHWEQRCGAFKSVTEGVALPTVDSVLDETNAAEAKAGYEVVEQSCQPTPAASSQPCRALSSAASSSKSLTSTNDHVAGSGGQKRKATSPPTSSREFSRPKNKDKSYSEQDAKSSRSFHKHSDGRITWAGDDES